MKRAIEHPVQILPARVTTIDWFNTLGESVTLATGLAFANRVMASATAGIDSTGMVSGRTNKIKVAQANTTSVWTSSD